MKIRLASPYISDEQEQAVLDVLRSGQLVAGPCVREFEACLADLVGRKHAVAVSSGTTALLSAMVALGIGPNSEVVVPAFTFPAPAMAAAFLGASVKICDIDPNTLNISVATLEAVLSGNESLVIAIDQFGVPAPVTEIEGICAQYQIPVLVDAACSIGASVEGRFCGSFGCMSTFSFHPRKIVTTAEGGAVLTDDDELARTIRQMRNVGMENGCFKGIGLNLRPSEMGAAMGLPQLRDLEKTVSRRLELKEIYNSLSVPFQHVPAGSRTNVQTLVAILSSRLGQGIRDDLREHLAAHGIETQVASYCLGEVDALRDRYGLNSENTPVAYNAHKFGIALPLHDRMSNEDARHVVSTIRTWFEQRGESI